MNGNFDYQVLNLTPLFYKDYPSSQYKEILRKNNRPYNCLLFKASYDYFICVPYRTNINHQYAYKFKSSQRSIAHSSGLDYTKIIIVKNHAYITSSDALIDKDEYNETRIHINKIQRDAFSFVNDYVDHITQKRLLHIKEFNRRYKRSTLPYFHQELGI